MENTQNPMTHQVPKWELTRWRQSQVFTPYQKVFIKNATWKPIHSIGIFICKFYQKDYYFNEARIYYIHKIYSIRTNKTQINDYKNWNLYFYPIFMKYDFKNFSNSLFFQLKVNFSIVKKTRKIIITKVKFYKYIDPINTNIF